MSVCPVYREDLLEGHVARGRNMLIQALEQSPAGTLVPYRDVLSYCLLCKRCGSVCPAKLSPDQITLHARNRMVETFGLTRIQRLVNRALLSHRSGLARMVGLAALLPSSASDGKKPFRHLADAAIIFSRYLAFPSLSSPTLRKRVEPITSPPDQLSIKGKVAVFPGCVFEYFQSHIAEDMISTLANQGYEVVYPKGPGCCGQALHSAGDFHTARMLAKRNIDVLSEYDTVITGCATCSSAMKAYGRWFEKEDPWQDKAMAFSGKVKDFSEFLGSRMEPVQENPSLPPMTVTYHDPCHLKQHQGVFEAPRKILNALPGIRFIEMENADACCGLGGSFGISHRDISTAIQEKKINAIAKTGAEAVVTSCPGCLMYLADGIRRNKLPVKVLHIAQLLKSGSVFYTHE
jgi:glycolate oxidase iron-sulfur subunit